MKKYILIPFKQYQDQQRNENQLKNKQMLGIDHSESGSTYVNSDSKLTNDTSTENAASQFSQNTVQKDSELIPNEENKITASANEALNKDQSSNDQPADSNSSLTESKTTPHTNSSSNHRKGRKRSVKRPSSKSDIKGRKKLKVKSNSASDISVHHNNGKSQETGNGHFWIKT